MHTVIRTQLDDIGFSAGELRPSRDLDPSTLTTELVIDIEAQVDVAGGAGDGNLIREQPLTLVKAIRVYDGASAPIINIDPRPLRQLAERQGAKALTGLALAGGGVQANTEVRQQLRLKFSDARSVSPIETALVARNPDQFKVEIEWVGAALKSGLVDALNDRAFTFDYARVRIQQRHDPHSYRKGIRPLFLPRIRTVEQSAAQTTQELALKIETTNRLRSILLWSVDNDVTTEAIINRITMKDDQETYWDRVYARSHHEFEQAEYGGATDDASIAMAYFLMEFPEYGRLGQVWSPGQGTHPRLVLDVTGAAARQVRAVLTELEVVPGVTAPLPAGVSF